MIVYPRASPSGIELLFRVHGSAVYRGFLPAFISSFILLIGVVTAGLDLADEDKVKFAEHPYAFQVMIAFFTFLITFRANFAYGRYWEGATAIHQMLSKWLDVGMNLAAYHMQSEQYKSIRPPSFGEHPQLVNVTREREHEERSETLSEYARRLDSSLAARNAAGGKGGMMEYLRRTRAKRISHAVDQSPSLQFRKSITVKDRNKLRSNIPVPKETNPRGSSHSRNLHAVPKLDGGVEQEEPSLFLQEVAHLISLLSAVAMSTLRHDLEGTEAPLVEYHPGLPWPPVDPDKLSAEFRMQYHESNRIQLACLSFLGFDRSDWHRTLYNAARPFRVLGGVSDEEIAMLQAAKGPYAKVGLCTMWLQTFITQEYMAGSTGAVAPPILSRLYQFISDGMIGYNQSRKIAQVPFPFPHAQLTIVYILVVICIFPFMFYSFVTSLWFACFLNFGTVLCFVGLHEVARELEQPFRNAPNDIPLTTFQAQFNEALVTMYAGFHPDSWWEPPPSTANEKSQDSMSSSQSRAKQTTSFAPLPSHKKPLR